MTLRQFLYVLTEETLDTQPYGEHAADLMGQSQWFDPGACEGEHVVEDVTCVVPPEAIQSQNSQVQIEVCEVPEAPPVDPGFTDVSVRGPDTNMVVLLDSDEEEPDLLFVSFCYCFFALCLSLARLGRHDITQNHRLMPQPLVCFAMWRRTYLTYMMYRPKPSPLPQRSGGGTYSIYVKHEHTQFSFVILARSCKSCTVKDLPDGHDVPAQAITTAEEWWWDLLDLCKTRTHSVFLCYSCKILQVMHCKGPT